MNLSVNESSAPLIGGTFSSNSAQGVNSADEASTHALNSHAPTSDEAKTQQREPLGGAHKALLISKAIGGVTLGIVGLPFIIPATFGGMLLGAVLRHTPAKTILFQSQPGSKEYEMEEKDFNRRTTNEIAYNKGIPFAVGFAIKGFSIALDALEEIEGKPPGREEEMEQSEPVPQDYSSLQAQPNTAASSLEEEKKAEEAKKKQEDSHQEMQAEANKHHPNNPANLS